MRVTEKKELDTILSYLSLELIEKVIGSLSGRDLLLLGIDLFESGENKKFLRRKFKKAKDFVSSSDKPEMVREICKELIKNSNTFRKHRNLINKLDSITIDERHDVKTSLIPELKRKIIENPDKYNSGKYYWALARSEDMPKRLLPTIITGNELLLTVDTLFGTLQYVDRLSEIIQRERFDRFSLEQEANELERQIQTKDSDISKLKAKIETLNKTSIQYIEKASTQQIDVSKQQNEGRNHTSQVSKLESKIVSLNDKITALNTQVDDLERELNLAYEVSEKTEDEKSAVLEKYRGKKIAIIGGDKTMNLDKLSNKYEIIFTQILTNQKHGKVRVPNNQDLYILRTGFIGHRHQLSLESNSTTQVEIKTLKYRSRGRGRFEDFLIANVSKLGM